MFVLADFGYGLFAKINRKWLLENYVVKFSPNIVIGYGKEQKTRYRKFNPNYKIAKSKTMKKIGIVFLCIAAIFLIMAVINYKTVQVVTVASIIIVSLIIGLLLIFIAKKAIDEIATK